MNSFLATPLQNVLPQAPARFLFAMTQVTGAHLYSFPTIAQTEPEAIAAYINAAAAEDDQFPVAATDCDRLHAYLTYWRGSVITRKNLDRGILSPCLVHYGEPRVLSWLVF